jgi:glycosyltransferase involved in cell wall biosynthesis
MAVELLAAKKAKIKVRIPHSHNTTSDHMKIHKILKPIFNRSYTHAFACGIKAGKWLYGKKDFVVINNGIDTKRFRFRDYQRKEIRKSYNIENKFVVGHVGVFNYQKNHEKIIEIFKRVHSINEDAILMLIGEGENYENIKELVERKGLSDCVIFVGTTNDVNMYMMAFDVFILPSRFEGMPLVLVEAQCCGLNCVTSTNVSREVDITGLVDFVDYENDFDTFVDKVCIVDNMNIDRDMIASEAMKTIKAKGYSIWDNGNRLKNLYLEYINK